jgi:hypothetical protein
MLRSAETDWSLKIAGATIVYISHLSDFRSELQNRKKSGKSGKDFCSAADADTHQVSIVHYWGYLEDACVTRMVV